MNSDRCGFLNFDELCAGLANESVEVTIDQVRSWSQKGLIPSAKSSGTRRYARSSISQIATCARLMEKKRDAKHAGWMLWFQGYDVASKYWHEPFERASKTLRLLRPLAKLNSNSDHDEDSFSDGVENTAEAVSELIPPPVSTNARRMDSNAKYDAIVILLNAVAGGYASGNLAPHEETPNHVITLIGARDAEKHVINGQTIGFGPAVNEIMIALAAMPNASLNVSTLGNNEMAMLEAARDDVRSVFEATLATQEAFQWIFGPSALGLRTIGCIARKHPVHVVATMILVWHEVRKKADGDFLNSEEIIALRDQSLETRRASLQLKELPETIPSLGAILTPTRLRRALKSNEELEKLVSEIRRVVCHTSL